MKEFSIWAPRAKQVRIVMGQKRHELTNAGGGWFVAGPGVPGPGEEYLLEIDDKQVYPDPRSAFQPRGVHGPSVRLDHEAYPWMDGNWRPPMFGAGSVIYEMHVGTFTAAGTFDAAIGHLEHLIRLGITHVEVMPVAAAPGVRGWGYDGVSLYAPHVAYGGPNGFRHFVDACHERGLAVLLDVVYNHLGPSGNYLAVYGPYFTKKYSTPWGEAINLDGPGSDDVRRFFIDNALMWLRDYHLDGLRLDAVHAIVDTSATHFLEQLSSEVRTLERQLERSLVLIAESDLNDPRLVQAPRLGGYGLDAMWVDDFHHALHTTLTSERAGYYEDFGGLSALAKALSNGVLYDGVYSPHRRRVHGRRFDGLTGHQIVVSLQNHDQVGNRAKGDRLAQLVSPSLAKIGAALLLTSPFVPLLFQGEEWGALTPFCYFTDHQEPELAAAVSAGRRREFAAFGWSPEEVPDPQDDATFLSSKLDWSELSRAEHSSGLEWYQKLIALRHSEPSIRDGSLEKTTVSFDEQARWLVMQRGNLLIACNFGSIPQSVPCAFGANHRKVLMSEPGASATDSGWTLPPQSCVVVA